MTDRHTGRTNEGDRERQREGRGGIREGQMLGEMNETDD